MTSGEKRPEDTEDAQASRAADTPSAEPAAADAPAPWGAAKPRTDAETTAQSDDAAPSDGGAKPGDAPDPDAKPADDDIDIATVESAAAAAAGPAPAPKRKSFLGRLLRVAVVLLIGGGAAFYLAPQIAPLLPGPVAALLAPATPAEGDAATAARNDDASSDAAMAARNDDASGDAATASRIDDASSAAATAGAEAAAAIEAARAVSGRLGALEETVAGIIASGGGEADPELTARLDTLESAVADLQKTLREASGGGGADPEAMAALRSEVAASIAASQTQADTVDAIQNAFAAQQAEIDALQGEINALGASGGPDTSKLAEQIAALQDAREADMAARADLAAAADMARRAATLSSSLSEIDRAMTFGEPFSGPLETAAQATDVEPPEALVNAARDGAPTRESLKASFPDAAYAAIQSSLEEEAAEESDGVFAGVVARLQARVTGLPNEPIAGDSVPAKLSRARAALLSGDIDAAVATIRALPEGAQAAMADWSQGAVLRSNADVALREWRAAIKLDVVGQ